MPPITPQSRTGPMVTWIVITAITSVTCAVLAIYFYVDSSKSRDEADKLTMQYKEIVAPAAINSDDINNLKQKRNEVDQGYNSSMTVLDIAVKERDDLAKKITGSGDSDAALRSADDTIKSAAAKAKAANVASLPQDLDGAINSLTTALAARQQEITSLTEQLKQAQNDATQDAAAMQANQQKLNDALATARAEAQQASAQLNSDRAAKDEEIKKIIADQATAQKSSQDQLTQAQASLTDVNRKNTDLQHRLDDALTKLGLHRADTAEAVVRQPDGQIIRVAQDNTVYINLGKGDQVSPGMTFQVYDRTKGIPPIGNLDSDDNMPRGKGSIEIVHVLPNASECHIVMLTPGQNIEQGDLIANLIYDKNTRYNFYVDPHGDFNLDQRTIPLLDPQNIDAEQATIHNIDVDNSHDIEVIKRLIKEWGGNVTDKINADTDFVILGKEPQLLTLTKEQSDEPLNQAFAQKSQATYDAYNDAKHQAMEYHIPILNQNRFLYFIGYYEMAQR
jgi:hypothetical protein